MHEQLVFTAKVADFEMDYMKFGSGSKTLVILPGMSLMSVMPMAPLCAGAYHSFTEDYTVYLFDRRKEFGLGYSVEDMATDTALVMKSLGIAHADIMGFSQGGMMAESIAENHPNLVRKLVLGSTFSRANETSNAVFDKWIRWTLEGKIETLISDFVDKLYTEKTAELCRQSIIDANRGASSRDREKFIAMAEACKAFDGFEALSKIKCPTLILGAALDKVLVADSSVEMYDKLKACGVPCELYIYEDYNHAVYDEAPDYRKRVLEFLRKL